MDRRTSSGLCSPARKMGERANELPAVGCLSLNIAVLWPCSGVSYAESSPAHVLDVYHLGMMESKGKILFP